MRQAGRSLPEYRALRVGNSLIEACLDPQLAAEITLQPVLRHGVDAAIFFSDIMIPLVLAGVDVDIQPGIGPVLGTPIRSAADVDRLITHEIDDASTITAAVELVVAELAASHPGVALIGFAGAPFTLAAYLVEGQPSRDHLRARAMMHADPDAWHRLMQWCAQLSARFMIIQVDAGAAAVQLFDSWAGALCRADYVKYVQPYSAMALRSFAGRVPRIHFAVASGHLLADLATVGAEVIGVDHRMGLDEAAAKLPGKVLQGNIDPALLFAGWEPLAAHARDVVKRGRQAPAHIVNLGHGVPPDADPQLLTDLVSLIHEL